MTKKVESGRHGPRGPLRPTPDPQPPPRRRAAPFVSTGWLALLLVVVSCAPIQPTLPPSATPSSTPPSASPPPDSPPPVGDGEPAFTLELESGGQSTRLFVFDPEGLLVEAWPADAREAAAAADALARRDIVAARGESHDTLIVAWLVTPCDRRAALTVVATDITVALPPRQGCDAVAIVRAVALRFADPGRAALFRPTLIDALILPEIVPPTPVAPPPTAEG